MIYIYYGDDRDSINLEIKNIIQNSSVSRISALNTTKDLLLNYANQNSLFGESFSIILENPISESDVSFDEDLLGAISMSPSNFIFLEDSLNAEEIKKYKKYTENISKFETIKTKIKDNPFVLVNLFENKDKMGTWLEYRRQIEEGGEPESLAGMFFWKIKSLMVSGNRNFTEKELKNYSKELVDIYHKSHVGILDMDIALEQFILKNL